MKRTARWLWVSTVLWSCGGSGETAPASAAMATVTVPGTVPGPAGAAGVRLIDATAALGLDFRHRNGMTGELYFHEMMGPGGGLFDYDGDGDLDLYLVQGGPIADGGGSSDAPAMGDRLYRNDTLGAGPGERSALRFTDVTAQSGLAALGYGMGVATGDFDNDGWTDLYVLNFGSNQLWRNNGPGADGRVTFSDVTERSGSDDPRWSVSASFFDFDRDGWLDLYVVNYVNYTLSSHQRCYAPNSRPDYCGPKSYRGEPDRLLRNRGDGRFEEVSAAAGIVGRYGSGMGVVTADFNGDGWQDVYVANDQMPNYLWLNRGDGSFAEEALLAGSAVNLSGDSEASMGVIAADLDNDGTEDLFMTHLMTQSNTLYLNQGEGFFQDRTPGSGLGGRSLNYTGFGAAAIDLDNDGWLDLAIANGSVEILEQLVGVGSDHPLDQKNQLFHNRAGHFVELGAEAGDFVALSEVSRGLASGDIDNDGDTDLLLINNHGAARLFLNEGGSEKHWLGLRLVSAAADRDALGARVVIRTPSGRALWRRAHSDGSYGSAVDPRVLVGLADEAAVDSVEVRWPSGSRESWFDVPVDRYSTLVEGEGQELEGP